MAQVLTVKRADVAALFVNPENGQAAFPASLDRENFEPFHIIGAMPQDFFRLESTLVEREIAEKDNVNLQIIPYVVMVDQEANKIFMYERGHGGAEDRLKKKCSIGLGGHIDIAPDAWTNLSQVVAKEALRELEEEVGFKTTEEEAANILEGFQVASSIIFTEADEVGTVHLGVSLLLNTKPDRFGQLENNVITSGQWLTFDEIALKIQNEEIELEAWSNLVMMHIQAINQQQANGIEGKLNGQMHAVHNAFNKMFTLAKATNNNDVAAEEWEAFKQALDSLNKRLDDMSAMNAITQALKEPEATEAISV